MPRIIPFCATHYNPRMIANLADVITPPYDNIPSHEIPEYLDRSRYNFAHVILPRTEEVPYARACLLLERWQQQSILVQDTSPSFYLYQQTFETGGLRYCRRTLMAAVELSEFSDGKVRPHENIHTRHKDDRLTILRKTHFNLSHIFAMIKDSKGFLASLYERWVFAPPLLNTRARDGVEHTVWQVQATKAPQLAPFLEDKPLYILDGHHRYLSALEYARETGALGNPSESASYALFSIANSCDPSLVVFPTHRRIQDFNTGTFDWETFDSFFDSRPVSEVELGQFTTTRSTSPSFIVWANPKLLLCTPKAWATSARKEFGPREHLAVTWSDEKFLAEIVGIKPEERASRIGYENNWEILWKERHSIGMAVFHSPPDVNTIADVADQGLFMPQKTTYFYPKLAAGLIMRKFTKPCG